jgi:hypothetical protein
MYQQCFQRSLLSFRFFSSFSSLSFSSLPFFSLVDPHLLVCFDVSLPMLFLYWAHKAASKTTQERKYRELFLCRRRLQGKSLLTGWLVDKLGTLKNRFFFFFFKFLKAGSFPDGAAVAIPGFGRQRWKTGLLPMVFIFFFFFFQFLIFH